MLRSLFGVNTTHLPGNEQVEQIMGMILLEERSKKYWEIIYYVSIAKPLAKVRQRWTKV